jgi:hypothetical protein
MAESNRPAAVPGGRLTQKAPTAFASGLLQSPPASGRQCRNIGPPFDQNDSQPGTQATDEVCIFRAFRTYAMIKVGSQESKGEDGRQGVQQVQQSDRIRAAGYGNKDPVSRGEKTLIAQDAVEGSQHGRTLSAALREERQGPLRNPERALRGMVAVQRFELRTLRI